MQNQINHYRAKNSVIYAWAVGGIADNLMANALPYLVMMIYNLALNVNPVYVGIALGLPRLWDAVTDPFMGNISDNTRTKWGRRRPYIAIGGILTGLVFATTFIPPVSLGTSVLFWFLLINCLIYYTAYTVFSVPYGAMGLELSTDYNDRTKIMAIRTVVAMIASFMLPWSYKLCFIFGRDDRFSYIAKSIANLWHKFSGLGSVVSIETQEVSSGVEIVGAGYVGICFGLVMALTALFAAVFTKENPEVQKQNKIDIISAFKFTFKNKILLIIMATIITAIMGNSIIIALANYVNIYYVYNGDKSAAATMLGIGGMVQAVGGILIAPVIVFASKIFGKKNTLTTGLSIVILGVISQWFFYTPDNPYLQLISQAMIFPGLVFVWIILASMLADVTDIDEYETNRRREGMYGAVYSWAFKGGIAVSAFIAGGVLALTKIEPKLGGAQSPESIMFLRLSLIFVPLFLYIVAFILSIANPLSRSEVKENRLKLDARKLAQLSY